MEDNTIKDIRKLFWLNKENEAIKERIIRVIKNLFELEKEENYHRPVRKGNFYSNS